MAIQSLIVCGEDSLVQSLAYKLGAMSLRVQTTNETLTASALLLRHHFDVVLVDCDLQDGLEFIELVRHKSLDHKTVVLALVSGADEARSASLLGSDFILNKPLNTAIADKALRAAHSMSILEARNSVRERVKSRATLSTGEVRFDATVVDVSESGLGLECTQKIDVGKQLEVEFLLPDCDRLVRCTGKVVRSEAGRVGIHFLYLSAASAEVVMGWLRTHSPRRSTTTAS